MTVFQKFFGRAEGVCAQFLKNNSPENAKGDELENSRKIITFSKVTLSPLKETYDLFELKTELTKFRDSLSVSEQSSADSTVANTESKRFSNELTDLINAIDTFVLYYSAIEERIDRYIRKGEGTWTAAGRELVINLGWIYAAKKESERANGQRDPHWVLTFKDKAEESLQSLYGSRTLLPSLQALIAELPGADYFNATKIEKSQQASKGYTFSLYKEKMQALLTQALETESAWGAQIESVSAVLTSWPAEQTSIVDLLMLRDKIEKACAENLVGNYYYSQIYMTMMNLLKELPSMRYENNTNLLDYRYTEQELTEKFKEQESHHSEKEKEIEEIEEIEKLTSQLEGLMRDKKALGGEKEELANENETLKEEKKKIEGAAKEKEEESQKKIEALAREVEELKQKQKQLEEEKGALISENTELRTANQKIVQLSTGKGSASAAYQNLVSGSKVVVFSDAGKATQLNGKKEEKKIEEKKTEGKEGASTNLKKKG